MTDTNKVYLLTSNGQTKQAYAKLLAGDSSLPRDSIMDVNDFVTRH